MLQLERDTKDTVLLLLLRQLKPDRKLYIKEYQKDYYVRNKRINLTVNDVDRGTICKLSEKENKLPSTFVKEIVICRLKEEYYLQEEIKSGLSEFVRNIRGIANNVNQIARNTNITAWSFNQGDFLGYLEWLESKVEKFISKAKKNDHKINE